MAATVARQEGDTLRAEAAHHDRVRRLSERRLDEGLALGLETLDVVETAASDDADVRGVVHFHVRPA